MSLLSFTPLFSITAAQPPNNNNNFLTATAKKKIQHILTPFRVFKPIPPVLDCSLSLFSYLHALPSDFPERWRKLVDVAEKAEARLCHVPLHVIQAVTASEDCRFFSHCGVDPYGIGRAVVNFPNGGGGSTITQQLTRRIFLSAERKFSRKFVEVMLSLVVEKRMSKRKIMYAYLSKTYWGHGMYGIEPASQFYFGKHPKFLDVGESALLAGILPAPEFLSPFANSKRGKTSQIRVLRRMVASGFLDMDTALEIASRPLCLRTKILCTSLRFSSYCHECYPDLSNKLDSNPMFDCQVGHKIKTPCAPNCHEKNHTAKLEELT